MDEVMICKLYKNNESMRSIAVKYNTNHKLIGRILKKNGIATRKPKNLRGKRKFPCDIDLKYNNMIAHLRWDIKLKWIKKFDDFEKLKFLNRAIANRDGRYNFTKTEYEKYIERFYKDEQFNKIYNKWIGNKNDKYLKPSIDHIVPRSKGGNNKLDNLQFLTWFENRCKNDMAQDEWSTFKKNMKEYLT